MAVAEMLTQSTQQSTQPTQEASQDKSLVNVEIWGSLIPFNPSNTHLKRIDLIKLQPKDTIGRSRQEDVDISFPKCMKMSE